MRNRWEKALNTFRQRVLLWKSLHLGMQLNAIVYRTFCCSLLSFLWQLEELPEDALQAEAWALRRLAPGPGNWVTAKELRNFSRAYGFPFEFASFSHMALSAKLRVLEYEPQLHVQLYQNQLQILLEFHQQDRTEWIDWYKNSYVSILLRAQCEAQKLGVTAQSIRREVLQKYKQAGHSRTADKLVKKHFQAYALHLLSVKRRTRHVWHIELLEYQECARRDFDPQGHQIFAPCFQAGSCQSSFGLVPYLV